MKSVSRSLFAMFPVDISKLVRLLPNKKRVDEVSIFGDYDSLLPLSDTVNFSISRAIAVREVEGVKRVVARFLQVMYERTRQVRINEKVHASTRLTRLSRAAKARAARMSSRSKSS